MFEQMISSIKCCIVKRNTLPYLTDKSGNYNGVMPQQTHRIIINASEIQAQLFVRELTPCIYIMSNSLYLYTRS